jgi:hypothetical protein
LTGFAVGLLCVDVLNGVDDADCADVLWFCERGVCDDEVTSFVTCAKNHKFCVVSESLVNKNGQQVPARWYQGLSFLLFQNL